MFAVFRQRWPLAFPQDLRQVKPLALGIHHDLATHLPEQPLRRISAVIGMFQHLSGAGYFLALLNHVVVRCLRFFEFAQTWQFDCKRKKPLTTRAYLPWWLEAGQKKERDDLSGFSASSAVRSGPGYDL